MRLLPFLLRMGRGRLLGRFLPGSFLTRYLLRRIIRRLFR